MTIKTSALVSFLDEYLKIKSIEDSSCNGLQVEGSDTVSKIGLAVDSGMAVFRKACAEKVDFLVLHHGMIWHGLKSVSGPVARQIRFLFDKGINLYGAHLPLDLHPVVGNNIQLAKILGLKRIESFGNYHGTMIGFKGEVVSPRSIDELSGILKRAINAQVITLPFGPKKIRTLGVVSGGAPHELSQAIDEKLDCYITGEATHGNFHTAADAGINVIYGGHYETETVGVKALGKVIEKKFGIRAVFLDVPTKI